MRRSPAAPVGRGRPAWLYEATNNDASGLEHLDVVAVLASAIRRTSTSPTEDAISAGTEWGHELARERGARPARNAVAARRQVVVLLDKIGFAPQPDSRASVVRLTRCPLLEAARKYPDVVCGVHLGLIRGALEEYGADPGSTELKPFSEPGACRLHLAGRRGGRSPSQNHESV